MNWITWIAQLIVALGIYNVWIVRFNKDTDWRGGNAINMKEEFAYYGLSERFMYLVGAAKVMLATLLIIGIGYPTIAQLSASCMTLLMSAAVIMHIKVHDPFKKMVPALSLVALSLLISAF